MRLEAGDHRFSVQGDARVLQKPFDEERLIREVRLAIDARIQSAPTTR